MASNPPTPIFAFEQHVPLSPAPSPSYVVNMPSPHRIPIIQFPNLPSAPSHRPVISNPMMFPPLTPPQVVISTSPQAVPAQGPLAGVGPLPRIVIPTLAGADRKPIVPQIVLPNLSKPAGSHLVSAPPTSPTGSTSVRIPMPLVYSPVVYSPSSPVYNHSTSSTYATLPSLRSPVQGYAQSSATGYPVPAASLRSPVPAAMRSPLLSVLSPKSPRSPSGSYHYAPLTPNSTAEMIREYQEQWMPTTDRQEPVRGVASVNTTYYQQQTVANHYHPVAIPTAMEEDHRMGSIYFPEGYNKQENAAVATHMRALMSVSASFAQCYKTTFKNLLPLKGMVNLTQFNQALAVYENNQVYYQECIDDGSITTAAITEGLVALERWFAAIIEPDACDNGADHRTFLQKKGVTAHCDPELYPYLTILLPA